MQTESDVVACVEGGADAVGVLVGTTHPAEDSVSLEAAAQLLSCLPPYVGRYAVTHLTGADDLVGLVERLPIDALQLHDDASPDVLGALRQAAPGLRLIKGLHVADECPDWQAFASSADAVLLDSVDAGAGRIGGTGKVHDWRLSAQVARSCPLPVILAGGLAPENVAEAVRLVRPWAVNVNTGVEVGGGKDRLRVASFVREANS